MKHSFNEYALSWAASNRPRVIQPITILAVFLVPILSVGMPVKAQGYSIGDLNADRRIDISDFRMLAEQWLDDFCLVPGCLADLDGADGVNVTDFSILAENWGSEKGSLFISEFMASNGSSVPLGPGELLDQDGDSSDWIEIFNPTNQAIELGGRYLTDDKEDLEKWEFPGGILIEPRDFLIVFMSGKNSVGDELHANFQINAEGGYLAIVGTDGKTVIWEHDYPPQVTDISYGIGQFSRTLIAAGDTAFYHIPDVLDAEAQWMAGAFDDQSWKTAKTGLGFMQTTPVVTDVTIPGDVVQGVPNDGDWPSNESPPLAIDDNINAKYLHFKGDFDPGDPATGAGFQVTPSMGPTIVTGLTFTTANDAADRDPTAFALYGSNTSIDGPYTLIAAGDIVDFSQATAWPRFTKNTTPITFSNDTAYDHYQLLFPAIRNAPASVAMQIGEVELLGVAAGPVSSDIRDEMLNINASLWLRLKFETSADEIGTFDVLSLRMKYEDGFVAYLNGVEVARRNCTGEAVWNSHADSDRPNDSAQEYVNIDLSNFLNLLTVGTNALAIHALNDSVSDENFFIQPELSAAVSVGASQYFKQATPREFNGSGAVNIVSDTKFSVNRGFYDAPFTVEIKTDTPDATIHYTLDGSTPTETAGLLYTGPIQISGTTCLRAMAFIPGWLSTNVDTQTYIFLDQVIRQPANPAGFPASWGGTTADYAMDQRVVNDARYSGLMRDSLLSLPTLSIVTDMENLFGSTGIYENSTLEGTIWECPVSIEWINADNTTGFQINAGLRAYGGAFRRMDLTRKKSFRLLFKREYGAPKLEYPFFDAEDATTRFDTLILRAGANDGWNNWGGANTQYIIDEYQRRTQLALGQRSGHGRFVHLYINGLYWGLYNPVERPEMSFAATYYGGDKTEWDAINASDPVGESTSTTWNSMLSQIRQGMGSIQAYEKIQGNDSDGTDNPAYDDVLDVDNYIDYLFSNIWGGTGDWGGRNWYVACRRPPNATGFKFFNWDMEGAIIIWSNLNTNVIGVSEAIQEPFQALRQNEEFRILFADHVHRHLFNNGPATSGPSWARYKELADEVELAIIAESARWGDQATGTPYTQADWQSKRDYILNTYMPQRPAIVLTQLKAAQLYPQVSAPQFRIDGVLQHGGHAPGDAVLTMTIPDSSVYADVTLVPEQVPVRVYIPSDDSLGLSWTGRTFVPDANWTDGSTTTGVGYERNSGYQDWIGTDVNTQMADSTSAYCRIQFNYDGSQVFEKLQLRMRYDDGFIAYLNGAEVYRTSNITAVTPPSAGADNHEAAATFEEFNISAHINKLVVGTNVLAIHGINYNTGSSDFIVQPLLVGQVLDTNPSSAPVLYTTDGADPRKLGGSQHPSALLYSGPIPLTRSALVKARTFTAGQWSALNETVFAVGPVKENLRITELMFHPADPNCEFIELQNIGTQSINLNLVKFTNGVDFAFGDLTLAPSGYTLVVQNIPEFTQRYGTGLPVAGQYVGLLENKGERIVLVDAIGTVIHDFEYKDGWFDIADGQGFSLTILNAANPDPLVWGQKLGWWPSSVLGGSPGTDDGGIVPPPGAIVINEILSHSHDIAPDWIELHNTTDEAIHIGGWFLSDSNLDDPNIMKYEIPAGIVIDGYGYKVFYQDLHFGSRFALSEGGETVYLRSGLNGELTGYAVEQEFGPAASGVSFGRYIKSTLDGGVNFVAMAENTPNEANSDPKVGPIVFTEMMYHPNAANTGDEYIELKNISDTAVTLQDVVGTETAPGVFSMTIVPWRFTEGIDFEFPLNTTIPAGGLLLVAKDKDELKAYYGAAIPSNVPILQWTAGSLDNAGEKIRLSRPGDQEYGKERYWIRAEQVSYDDTAPWPTEPDGTGKVLQRIATTAYGNDVTNWQAATPSPGQ